MVQPIDEITSPVDEFTGSGTGGSSGAPTDATYVTTGSNSTLTDERVLTAGEAITVTDSTAGTVTVAISETGLSTVSPGTGDTVLGFDASNSGVAVTFAQSALGSGGGGSSFSGASVYRSTSSNVSLNDSSLTEIGFNAERFDVGGWHVTTGATNNRLVPPSGVDYVTIEGTFIFAANANGHRRMTVRYYDSSNSLLNTVYAASVSAFSGTRNTALPFCTGPLAVTGNAFFKLAAYQNSGTSINLRCGDSEFKATIRDLT